MDRDEALRLRDEIEAGRRRLQDLEGEEFQRLMYWLLVDRFIPRTRWITVSNQYRGEVDFVVEEHLDPPSSDVPLGRAERTHFFECKRYGRRFELADVGKLFCAAIRHYPETVALVSTTPLQPQAQDYATLFFGPDGRFPRIVFENLRAEMLLGIPLPTETPVPPGQEAQPPSTQLEWRLVEHGVFYDRVVASTETRVARLSLAADRRYTLEISGTAPAKTNRSGVEIDLFSPGSDASPFHLRSAPRLFGHSFQATFDVDLARLAAARSYALAVHIRASKTRQTVTTLPFPEIEAVPGIESTLPDLRAALSRSIIDHLRGGDEVLTFVTGEAGVGKSFLCSRVAGELKFRWGYDVENFRADRVVDGSLFVRMLVRLLTPTLQREADAADADFASQLVAEAVRRLLPPGATAESESVVQAVTGSGAAHGQPELVIPLLATLLAGSGNLLVVLQDCHELPPTLISALDALVVALDERGWAGTRLIFEYRTGPGVDNPTWTAFVRRVQSTLHARTRTEILRNLSRVEVEAVLRPVFEAIDDDMIAAIWSRTGGNPLLLSSLLHSYVALGVVEHPSADGGGKFQVRHPARILEARATVADKPRRVLEDRLWLLDAAIPRGVDSLTSVVPLLAIFALTEGFLSWEAVFAMFGVTPAGGERLRRWLVREQVLLAGADDSAPQFAHELIRDTAVELGRTDERTLSLAERILDETQPSGYVAVLRMAELARYVGDFRLAWEYLDLGQESARNENRFDWSRRFQIQLLEALHALPNPSQRDRFRQMSLLDDLGWSEHNAGSNWASREYFRESRAIAESLPVGVGDWTPQLMRSTLAHLDHRIMTVDLELLDFVAFLASATQALERVAEPTVLGQIINRLILCCAELGFVDPGVYFTQAGVALAPASTDPEVDAVLCTDIGSFLAPALATQALDLLEQGVGLAHSERQRLQNEYSRMACRLWVTGRIAPEPEREALSRRLHELGMKVLVGAFTNYEGVVQLIQGDVADARRLFAQAEIHARLYEQLGLEVAVWNNAMVTALLQEDPASARSYAVRLAKFWTWLTEQRRLVAGHWDRLIEAFERARARVEAPDHPPRLQVSATPPFAGSLLASLVNLAALAESGWVMDVPDFDPQALLSEWVSSGAGVCLSGCSVVVSDWRGTPLYLDP